MATPKFALTTYDRRVYTHRTLFKIAERALKRAQAEPVHATQAVSVAPPKKIVVITVR